MPSDNEDYMSDTFLAECVKNDIKPGLINSQTEKRKFAAIERKNLHNELNRKIHPSIKTMELERREEGLNKPLEENNKGFALLQKMGYTPGTGIGRSAGGPTEPIHVSVKNNREGLGREKQQRKALVKIKKPLASSNTVSTKEYRARFVETYSQKRMQKDLRDSQRACQYLDRKQGNSKPVCSWFWLDTFTGDTKTKDYNELPERRTLLDDDSDVDNESVASYESDDDTSEISDSENYVQKTSEVEDDENLQVEEKLEVLTSFLRKSYYYCIWCGTEYDNVADLESSCPGDKGDLH